MTKARTVALAAGTLVLLIGAGTAAATSSGSGGRRADDTAATATSPSTSTTEDRPTGTAPAQPPQLSADDAKQIALNRVGGGQVGQVEQEVEHGQVQWKVRITRNGTTYDVRVDAGTGTVTRVDTGQRGDQATPTSSRTTPSQQPGDDRGRGRGTDDGPGHDAGDDHGGRR